MARLENDVKTEVIAEPEAEPTEEEVRSRLSRVQEYHSPRRLDGDGWTMLWCRECRQNYPCPTAEAVNGKW